MDAACPVLTSPVNVTTRPTLKRCVKRLQNLFVPENPIPNTNPKMIPPELLKLPALSIRQPWAWYIVRPDLTDPAERLAQCKDIENRNWRRKCPPRFLVHASSSMTGKEFESATLTVALRFPNIREPAPEELLSGGIIGVVDCGAAVDRADSRWFFGPFGYPLSNARPLPFYPCRGTLGFFHLPLESSRS
jgi:hypothetical protein